MNAVAANPNLWKKLSLPGQPGGLQPLLQAVIGGLASGQTRLLTGPVLVEAFRNCLMTLSRVGSDWVGGQNDPAELKKLLEGSLEQANELVGREIDGENLPEFINQVIAGFLRAPFEVLAAGGQAKLEALSKKIADSLSAT